MGGVGGEGKALVSGTVAAQHRKRMDHDALPTKHKPAGGKDDLYDKLWHACAGPLVYVPSAGDIVYYFLQGHMEQVEACTSQECKMEMPIYNLPPKILCEVVYVNLKADAGTEDVFAQITLRPKLELNELSLEVGNSPPLPPKINVCTFSKKLTPSDTSTHGGFSVPKRHADECLPPLDTSLDPPLQELVAKDLHGLEWRFRHIYRGQPKRHLLTSGWSVFVTSKKIVAGDACIFLRGETGELRVGVRRALKLQNSATTSVISGPSMQHGILAGAFHAVSTGTMFTVYYHPWTSPAQFIIPLNQYMKSDEINYSVGTRFRMAFEGEDCVEQRIAGTVVGTEDVDHIRWPASEWRCLKVKWDATTDSIMRPSRVSPWNIEPIESANKRPASVLHRQKRLRPNDASSPKFYSLFSTGQEGREDRVTGANELSASTPQLLPYLVPPANPVWGHMQLGLENNLKFPMDDPFYLYPNSMVSLLDGSIMNPGLFNHRPGSPFAPPGVCENAAQSKSFSAPNANSANSGCQVGKALELKDENRIPLAQPNGGSRYMLFGVNLVNSPPELPSPQIATSNELQSPCSVPPTSQSSVSETIQVSESSNKSVSGIPLEKQCKNCIVSRSCTKVIKFGTTLGRSVELTRFDGYDELISELDQMFNFKGSLMDGSSGWHVAYTDNEGDMMLIGDNPWQEFQCAVRRIFICPKEDIDKLNPSSPPL